jgi:Amino acid permease
MTNQGRQSLFRRMPIDQMDEIEKESGAGVLAKSLGLWQLTAIGVGGIIGVGIFSLAGLVAAGDEDNPGVGPAVLIAFLIAGLASAAAAMSYAEFAGMIPRAGSAYAYGYVALGEIVGWFIGWDLLLEYDRDRADADLLRRAAAWLRENPDRAGYAGLSHDPTPTRWPRCSTSSPTPSPISTPLFGGRPSRPAESCSASPWPHRPGAAPDADDSRAPQPRLPPPPRICRSRLVGCQVVGFQVVDRRASPYTAPASSAVRLAGKARTASIRLVVITTVTPDGQPWTTSRPPTMTISGRTGTPARPARPPP